jgi:hypothetical protein
MDPVQLLDRRDALEITANRAAARGKAANAAAIKRLDAFDRAHPEILAGIVRAWGKR